MAFRFGRTNLTRIESGRTNPGARTTSPKHLGFWQNEPEPVQMIV
jgi:hypothetical protein